MSCTAEKVTAFIVQETDAGRQVLLFRHPSFAGTSSSLPLDDLLATGGQVIVEPQRHWINYLRASSNATPLQPRSHGSFP